MTTFWDCEDVFLVDFLPRSTTINSPYYASLLHQLHSSIREKHRRKYMWGVLLRHHNVPVHNPNITQTPIQYTGFTKLNHSAYSPDIAPNDYHLFSNLKNFLQDRNFETDDEAIMIVHHCLKSLDADCFSRCIES